MITLTLEPLGLYLAAVIIWLGLVIPMYTSHDSWFLGILWSIIILLLAAGIYFAMVGFNVLCGA